MKKKRMWRIAAAVAAVLLAAVLLRRPAYELYRQLDYHIGGPTAAERTVMAYARAQGIPYGDYPPELIDFLDKNPEAEEFVLGYPTRQEEPATLAGVSRDTVPLLLQWDRRWGYAPYGSGMIAETGCGPVCLAMAGYYLTGEDRFAPDRVAAFAEENGYYAEGYGSSWTLISRGAAELGLTARELPLDREAIDSALEAGEPVILAMGPGDFTTTGHFILLAAVTQEGYRVNDPNSRLRSGMLWRYEDIAEQIRNIWAISGICG